MGVRLLVILMGVPILLWTLLSVFIRNVGNAAWFAWNETSMEFDQMRAAFKSKSMNQEDWK